jgi:Flp pilus assembly protein TadB
MKKFIFCLMTSLLVLTAAPELKANTVSEKMGTTVDTISMKKLESRLNEIKAIDKSKLTREERKELRKEVRDIDRERQELVVGMYISLGALIIIILLLVIFF